MKFKGYLLLIFTVLTFSAMEVVSAPLKGLMDPLQTTFMRFLLGGLFLLPFALAKKERVTRKDLAFFLGLGALNILISMSCLQASVFFGKASTAAMLISSNPIFVMFFSVIFLKEKWQLRKVVTLIFGILGLLLISSRFGVGGDTLMGIVFGLLAAVTFGLYTVLSRLKSESVSTLTLLAYSSLMGCALYLPYFFVSGQSPIVFPAGHLMRLLYMGFVLSGITYLAYMEALKILGAGKGSMIFFMKPAIAAILAVIFLSEKLMGLTVAGSALILVGMAINFVPIVPKSVPKNQNPSRRL